MQMHTSAVDSMRGRYVNGHQSGSTFNPGNDTRFRELLKNIQHSNQNLHKDPSGLNKSEASGRSNQQM